MILISLVQAAYAGAAVLSAAGGFDMPTDQPWSGVEIALHATNTKGFAPIARFAPAYGFGDRGPIAFGELGLLAVLPEDEAVLRAGLAVRPTFLYAQERMPVGFGDPENGRIFGITPAVYGVIEFEFHPESPWTLGIRGGPASTASDYQCEVDNPDLPTCLTWHVGFGGGFEVRKRWESGLALDAILGTTTQLSVGWTL